MPRTTIAVTDVTRAGVLRPAGTAADVANGNQCDNDGRVFLSCNNTNGSTQTVTIVTPGTVDTLAVADRVVTLLTTEVKLIGPFPPTQYNAGNVLQFDATHAGVLIAPIRVPPQ